MCLPERHQVVSRAGSGCGGLIVERADAQTEEVYLCILAFPMVLFWEVWEISRPHTMPIYLPRPLGRRVGHRRPLSALIHVIDRSAVL